MCAVASGDHQGRRRPVQLAALRRRPRPAARKRAARASAAAPPLAALVSQAWFNALSLHRKHDPAVGTLLRCQLRLQLIGRETSSDHAFCDPFISNLLYLRLHVNSV